MDESYYDCWKILLRPLQSWAWGLKSSVHRGGASGYAGHVERRPGISNAGSRVLLVWVWKV